MTDIQKSALRILYVRRSAVARNQMEDNLTRGRMAAAVRAAGIADGYGSSLDSYTALVSAAARPLTAAEDRTYCAAARAAEGAIGRFEFNYARGYSAE